MSLIPWDIHYPYQNDEILNLDWVLKQIKLFKETLESWADTIRELQEGLADIQDWETRIEALEVMSAKIPVIEKSLNDLANLHDVDVKTLKAMIADLQRQIDDLDITALRIYIDSRDNELMADYNKKIYDNYVVTYQLFNALKDRLEILAQIVAELDTKAYNPWPRRIAKEALQDNLNYAYSDLADSVPTAEEFAELGLSATEYSAYDMLARDYSVRGKFNLRMHFVYSPVYGYKQEINNVLTSIVNYVKHTMSADSYTQLDLDADAYTALDLTAEDYYSYNNQQGYIGTGGDGLTSDQYSSLTIL